MITLLVLPLAAALILGFVHVYFGAFVLRRGIIFVDLALAQWAALGYIVGSVMHLHSPFLLFLTGFVFTLIASAFLTLFTGYEYMRKGIDHAISEDEKN